MVPHPLLLCGDRQIRHQRGAHSQRIFEGPCSPTSQQCTDFIQFVLFATYANKYNLGLDPGIARVVDVDDSLQYQFSVPKNLLSNDFVVYQTTGIQAECALSAGLYGKGRSVYTAKPADRLGDGLSIRSEEPEFVLRDTHLLPRDPRESEMQRQLVHDIDEIAETKEEAERLKKFFVKIASDNAVKYNVQRRSPRFTWPKRTFRQRWITVYAERCHDLYEVDDPVLFHRALAEVMICEFLAASLLSFADGLCVCSHEVPIPRRSRPS